MHYVNAFLPYQWQYTNLSLLRIEKSWIWRHFESDLIHSDTKHGNFLNSWITFGQYKLIDQEYIEML